MNDDRREHLETIAASLTNAFYSVRGGATLDHRDLLETYRFLLDSLVEYDELPEGHTPLRAADTLGGFDTDSAEPNVTDAPGR